MRVHDIKKKLLSALVLSLGLTLAACGSNEVQIITNEKSDIPTYRNMEEGVIYILHENNTLENLFFPTTTFEYGSTGAGDDTRIMWFKEDWQMIPTLYQNDRLIMFSTKVLDEHFQFERFEDFGYTIGLRGITETDSRRFGISTKPDDMCTFPKGDTDELILQNNSIVIMDELAGMKLRFPEEPLKEGEEDEFLTRVGTIKNLQKDKKYQAKIYAGTELPKDYVFTADVRVLGSMEGYDSTSYYFASGNIIEIIIPQWFNNGYYMVNGQGVFRLVNGTAPIGDEPETYNIPNENPDEEEEKETEVVEGQPFNPEPIGDDRTTAGEETVYDHTEQFELQGEGPLQIRIKFTNPDGSADTTKFHNTHAYIFGPTGGRMGQFTDSGDCLSFNFYASALGTYSISLVDLGDLTPEFTYN